METSYLQDPSQCGNVLKGFEGFLSASKNTALYEVTENEIFFTFNFYFYDYISLIFHWRLYGLNVCVLNSKCMIIFSENTETGLFLKFILGVPCLIMLIRISSLFHILVMFLVGLDTCTFNTSKSHLWSGEVLKVSVFVLYLFSMWSILTNDCHGGTILNPYILPFMLFGPLLKVTLPSLFSIAIQCTSWCKTE